MNEAQARSLEARIHEEAPDLKTCVEQKWVVRVEDNDGFWKDIRFVGDWENTGTTLDIYNSNWPRKGGAVIHGNDHVAP